MTSQNNTCSVDDISAFIDGELSSDNEAVFESHLAECQNCRHELNEQKIFLSAVNASLESKEKITVPINFTRTIIANAESNVSGLRDPSERSPAIWICSMILIKSIFAVGAESLGILSRIAQTATVLADFAAKIFNTIAVATGVIMRSFAAASSVESPMFIYLAAIVFILSVYVCVRLIPKIRRSR
jgi:anti-sigma factor RsiW